ncbi:MAG: hypothetical protein ACF8NJ_04405 [Phycisphaerales bacterium JB038]
MAANALKRMARWAPAILILALLGPVLMSANPTLADKLIFKDGRVWDGTILMEKDELIKFRMEVGGIEQVHWVSLDQLKRVVREEGGGDEATTDSQKRDAKPKSLKDFDPEVPTMVFIPMGFGSGEDMVGTYMNRKPLRESLEKAAELGDNAIAVLVFNSGGGMLLEIEPMSDLIEEYKGKIRVVAWIKSAISAAAMTAHAIPEIYFMPEGHYGGCTGFFGTGSGYQEVSGQALEEVLLMMERISERGGYDPLIMRKMQVNWFALSADISPDGVVSFHPDDSGEYMVNAEGKILTFNSETAMQFGFGKGVAETEQELADLLQLTEWQRADFGEEIMLDWRDNIKTAEAEIPKIRVKLDRALGEAGSGNERTRRRALGQARNYLRQLQVWLKKAEIICMMNGINEDVLRQIDRQIRELATRD